MLNFLAELSVCPVLNIVQAQEVMTKIIEIGFDTNDVGPKAVEGQKNYLAGFIDAMFMLGRIEEEVRAALHSMYFEGFSEEFAIELPPEPA